MTPRPTSGSWADDLYQSLAPIMYADEANDWHGAIYIGGIGALFQEFRDLVQASEDNGEDAWHTILDPDLIPAKYLPWLGQWVGVRLAIVGDLSEPATAERAQIKQHSNFQRGTPSAILNAIQSTLTGTKHVTFVERYLGNAYRQNVIVYDYETPNPAAALNSYLSQKPGGILYNFNVIPGEAWDESTVTWDTPASGVTWDTASGNV
jgi:hypothetical protein